MKLFTSQSAAQQIKRIESKLYGEKDLFVSPEVKQHLVDRIKIIYDIREKGEIVLELYTLICADALNYNCDYTMDLHMELLEEYEKQRQQIKKSCQKKK